MFEVSSDFSSILEIEDYFSKLDKSIFDKDFRSKIFLNLSVMFSQISDYSRSKKHAVNCLKSAGVNSVYYKKCNCHIGIIGLKKTVGLAEDKHIELCNECCEEKGFKTNESCAESYYYQAIGNSFNGNISESNSLVQKAYLITKSSKLKLACMRQLALISAMNSNWCEALAWLEDCEYFINIYNIRNVEKVEMLLCKADVLERMDNIKQANAAYKLALEESQILSLKTVANGNPLLLETITRYLDFANSNTIRIDRPEIIQFLKLSLSELVYWDQAYITLDAQHIFATKIYELIEIFIEYVSVFLPNDKIVLTALWPLIDYVKISNLSNQRFFLNSYLHNRNASNIRDIVNLKSKIAKQRHKILEMRRVGRLEERTLIVLDSLEIVYNRIKRSHLHMLESSDGLHVTQKMKEYNNGITFVTFYNTKHSWFYLVKNADSIALISDRNVEVIEGNNTLSPIIWQNVVNSLKLNLLNKIDYNGVVLLNPGGNLGSKSFESIILDSTTTPPTYLFQKTPIAYSLGLHLARDFSEYETDEPRLVSFAPYFDKKTAKSTRDCSDEVYSYLKCNQEEAENVAKIMGGTAYTGKQATKKRLMESIDEYDIIHLATHACVDTVNYYNSSIILDDGPLLMSDLYETDWNGKTVVLSACNTAQGKVVSGEGVFNFARTLTELGAKEVIVSLWPIDDCSTKDLVEKFYTYLKEGYNSPKALQLARIEYLEEADKLHSQPKFWAPLILISNDINVGKVKKTNARYWWIGGGLLTLFGAGLFYRQKVKRTMQSKKMAV